MFSSSPDPEVTTGILASNRECRGCRRKKMSLGAVVWYVYFPPRRQGRKGHKEGPFCSDSCANERLERALET